MCRSLAKLVGWSFAVSVALCAAPASMATAQTLFTETFDSFFAPPENFNGAQFDSKHPLAVGGGVENWEKLGAGTVHAVDHANIIDFSGSDYAAMIWQDNVITLNNPIAGSNGSGQTYTVNFRDSPAVYQLGAQQTSAEDGILIEVLRADDSVLSSYTHLPGAWAGDVILNNTEFQYVGDGSGDIRLRVGPSNPNSGRFGGAVDDLKLRGATELFSEDFNNFTAPQPNFNGNQFESGKKVAFGGELVEWSKAGGGAVHAVITGLADNSTNNPRDFAVMIWHDNVITQFAFQPIAQSNTAGQAYRVDFLASPAVYQNAAQTTSEEDGILVELLRSDDSVLASHTYLPGAWEGEIELVPVSFQYTGDGSGDVRFRVGPSNPLVGRFGGAIDNLTLSLANGLPGDFNDNGAVDAADYVVWRKHLNSADESVLNGNGNGMNGVDAADYQLWRANFGSPQAAGFGAGAQGVPEPSTWLLLIAAALVYVGSKDRERVV